MVASDLRGIRRSFDRAASSYDAAAVLQFEIRALLLERLKLTALAPALVVDAGAGTGHASYVLKRRYPKAQVLAIDASHGMLRVAGKQNSWWHPIGRVCANLGVLPLATASVDLIISNLALHWCDPETVFAEFRRVLAPQGFLSFSSFGPETLRELRTAWARIDSHEHVNTFIDMHDLGDALVRAGFKGPVLDMDRYTLKYKNVSALTHDLKAMGTTQVLGRQLKGLTGCAKPRRMAAAYEEFRQEGLLPATYEVIFGQAWAPTTNTQLQAEQGATVSLQEMKRQLNSRSTR